MTVKEFKDLPGFKDANVAELESIGITTVDQLKEAVNDKADRLRMYSEKTDSRKLLTEWLMLMRIPVYLILQRQ